MTKTHAQYYHLPRPWASCQIRKITLSRWQGKRSLHSQRMHNPLLYASGKRPMLYIAAHTVRTSNVVVVVCYNTVLWVLIILCNVIHDVKMSKILFSNVNPMLNSTAARRFYLWHGYSCNGETTSLYWGGRILLNSIRRYICDVRNIGNNVVWKEIREYYQTEKLYLHHSLSHSIVEYTCIHTSPPCCYMCRHSHMAILLCIHRHLKYKTHIIVI